MKGICQVCGRKVELIMRIREPDAAIDGAAIHTGNISNGHLVTEEHTDPRGEYCNGSLAMPEKIIS
ncbi:MAG: hypothetical protein KBD19_02235 [Candidatus Moranbacteria bacterium]|nr:hypothetical protein [Candidatus Moranbacteria bacterium]